MAKTRSSFVCQACGAVSSRWAGRCESCGEWNTVAEEAQPESAPKGLGGKKGRRIEFVSLADAPSTIYSRYISGIAEFDRVLGGGLVPGSAVLIGGDPGIGKSTLLLQAVCALSKRGVRCVYVSGEESADQVRMRAGRLGLQDSPVALASATNVRDILASVDTGPGEQGTRLLVIDSIQTMFIDSIESAPGTVTQVRTSAQEIIRHAKTKDMAVIFVGHVTKDGQIAGPRVLEHMVDTVLHFEGDRSHHFRILRGVKNRFGPTDEIGVFEMAGEGLAEVENPSALFLSQRNGEVSGSAVLAALEGTRPMLVEVQALVAPSSFGSPRRSVIGWDPGRLAMILAVLETRCGLQLSGCDVFLNIAGGIRINEPAADMAVAAALVSALQNVALPAETVFFGEIGLAGEVRRVAQADLRLKEAAKLGFREAIIPKIKKKGEKNLPPDMRVEELEHVQALEDFFSARRGGVRAA